MTVTTASQDVLGQDPLWSGELDFLQRCCDTAARRKSRRGIVEADDLSQSLMEWILRNTAKRVGWYKVIESKPVADNLRMARGTAQSRILGQAGRIVRQELEDGVRFGYLPEHLLDQSHWDAERVADLLPVAIEPDALLHRQQMATPDEMNTDGDTGKHFDAPKAPAKDPRQHNNWMSDILDLRRALERAEVDPWHHYAWHLSVVEGETLEQIGARFGTSKTSIFRWLERFHDDLAKFLNGEFIRRTTAAA